MLDRNVTLSNLDLSINYFVCCSIIVIFCLTQNVGNYLFFSSEMFVNSTSSFALIWKIKLFKIARLHLMTLLNIDKYKTHFHWKKISFKCKICVKISYKNLETKSLLIGCSLSFTLANSSKLFLKTVFLFNFKQGHLYPLQSWVMMCSLEKWICRTLAVSTLWKFENREI